MSQTAFSEEVFEQKLLKLRDTHDSISNLSTWCLNYAAHKSAIVTTWLNVLKKVKIDQRLTMFYLANDIIQYSKRKNLPFVDVFAPVLQKATTMVRDNKIKNKILRLFKIWKERGVYDEAVISDLSGLLSTSHKITQRMDIEDFQPHVLYSRLKSCKQLEEATDEKMKAVSKVDKSLTDVSSVLASLKDRKTSEEVLSELDEAVKDITSCINSLEDEIRERKGLIDLLDLGGQFYAKDYGEAQSVTNAYKIFQNRVKNVKRKLLIRIETVPLSETPPPPPEPGEVPSPAISPDNMSSSFTLSGSFMDGTKVCDTSIADLMLNAENEKNPPAPVPPPIILGSVTQSHMLYNTHMENGYLHFYTKPPPPPPLSPPPLPKDSVIPPIQPVVVQTVQPPLPPPWRRDHQPFFMTQEGSKIEVINSSSPLASVIKSPPMFGCNQDSFDSIASSPITYSPDPIQGLENSPDSFSGNKVNKIEVIGQAAQPLSTLLQSMVPPKQSKQVIVAGPIESPMSPPTHEKVGFNIRTGESNTKTDVDLRMKDIDHRNLIRVTLDSDTSIPIFTIDEKEDSKDNVDNVDMELSDDDKDASIVKKKLTKGASPCNGKLNEKKTKTPDREIATSEKMIPLSAPPPPPLPPMLPDWGESGFKFENDNFQPSQFNTKWSNTNPIQDIQNNFSNQPYSPIPPPPPPLPSQATTILSQTPPFTGAHFDASIYAPQPTFPTPNDFSQKQTNRSNRFQSLNAQRFSSSTPNTPPGTRGQFRPRNQNQSRRPFQSHPYQRLPFNSRGATQYQQW